MDSGDEPSAETFRRAVIESDANLCAPRSFIETTLLYVAR